MTHALVGQGSMLAFAAAVAFAAVIPAQAQEANFPNKPIRIIVPFTPGGGNDLMARLIGQKLGDRFGRPNIVENRPGAGGAVGSEYAARQPADGYTILIASTSFTQNAAIRKLPYDAVTSFAPVAQLGSGPIVLATTPSLPVRSIKELIALAKRRPGELSYASAGAGGVNHFAGELFKLETGTNMVHVPYKGGTPAMTDVMAGHVQVLFNALTSALPFIHSGRLKALGVGTLKRSPTLPDVPTFSEFVPGSESIVWWGLLAPAGTPPAILAKLNSAINAVLTDADVKKMLAAQAADPVTGPPEMFGKLVREEVAKWTRVAKAAGIKVE